MVFWVAIVLHSDVVRLTLCTTGIATGFVRCDTGEDEKSEFEYARFHFVSEPPDPVFHKKVGDQILT